MAIASLPRWARWLLGLAVVLLLILAAGLAWALPAPLPQLSPEIADRRPDVARGGYFAVVGDCTACHSRPGGAVFGGGAALATPLGAVYPPNITPDRDYGAGRYTLPEWIRMMRQGVARTGRRLYPAMPYPAYAKLSDADLQDLWGYFQQGVAPSAQHTRRDDIPWPLSIRWPLAFWNKLFLDETRFRPAAGKPADWNRGAYLVQGLGHCGTCHTPRGLAFQELATADTSPAYLSGALLNGQTAANLRSNNWSGLGRWSPDEIVELLKTARTSRNVVAGQMVEVVQHSTQYMSDSDLRAIALYLKSLSPAPGPQPSFTPSNATEARMLAGGANDPGARMYLDSCSACHRWNGQGQDHAFPALPGNTTVLQRDPASLITIILAGGRLPSTSGAPSPLAMPAFGWRYSDEQVAQLATFVRRSWGNNAPAVDPREVRKLRKLSVKKDHPR